MADAQDDEAPRAAISGYLLDGIKETASHITYGITQEGKNYTVESLSLYLDWGKRERFCSSSLQKYTYISWSRVASIRSQIFH